MKLFGARKAASSAATSRKKGAGQRLELIYENEHSSKALALGVTWRSIATSGGRDDAVKQARAAGASHFIFRNQQAGWGQTPADVDATLRVFPAAAVAARALMGAAIVALKFPPRDSVAGECDYWIAVVLNGQPTSVDEFHKDMDDAGALQRVRELLEEIAGNKPAVHTNIPNHGLDGARPFAPDELLRASTLESDQLQPLPKAAPSIPKPVLAIAAVMVVILAAKQGYAKYEAWQRARAAVQAQQADVDPEQAWADAIAAWERGIAAPNGKGLVAVRASLDKLAVDWNGWKLTTANCSAAAPVTAGAAATRAWGCTANYTRQATSKPNREMSQESLPAGWKLAFTPLNGLTVSWTVDEPVQTLKIRELRKPEFFSVEVASRLQRLVPAFAGDLGFGFAVVTIPAPKKQDGTNLPGDPRAEGITVASLAVGAPLRSIDALIDADIEADWRALSVRFTEGLGTGIKGSAVMADVKGEMYAKR
ncbi:hypothetical protein [Ramlibacter sp. AN1133]|uniref:hypothetical protein n=1 Tax=Ramlibacter sp. AN1133 TaxID=3133429 RepID=UPI0030C2039B